LARRAKMRRGARRRTPSLARRAKMRRGARRRVPSLARSRVGLVCDLPGRLWQALGNSTKASDQALLADLTAALAREPGSADLSNALGVAAAMGSQAKGQAPIDDFHQ